MYIFSNPAKKPKKNLASTGLSSLYQEKTPLYTRAKHDERIKPHHRKSVSKGNR